MTVPVVLSVLKASSAVTDIVGAGTSAKISPLIKSQSISCPAVTIQRVSTSPVNSLAASPHAQLDSTRMQVDCWDTSYSGVTLLATACRSAMNAAGFVIVGEFDNYEQDIDPGIYRVTLDFNVWI